MPVEGFIKSAETVCAEIFREIQSNRKGLQGTQCLVLASQEIINRLIDEDADNVSGLSEMLGKTIRLQVETSFAQEQFDVCVVSD